MIVYVWGQIDLDGSGQGRDEARRTEAVRSVRAREREAVKTLPSHSVSPHPDPELQPQSARPIQIFPPTVSCAHRPLIPLNTMTWPTPHRPHNLQLHNKI